MKTDTQIMNELAVSSVFFETSIFLGLLQKRLNFRLLKTNKYK